MLKVHSRKSGKSWPVTELRLIGQRYHVKFADITLARWFTFGGSDDTGQYYLEWKEIQR